MNRGILKISDVLPAGLLDDMAKPEVLPAAEAVKAPKPKPPRVIGDPTREPVNRQAALMTAKAGWLYQPLPPEAPIKPELERLREENARLKLVNENLVKTVAVLERRVALLKAAAGGKRAAGPVVMVVGQPPSVNEAKTELLERLKNGV